MDKVQMRVYRWVRRMGMSWLDLCDGVSYRGLNSYCHGLERENHRLRFELRQEKSENDTLRGWRDQLQRQIKWMRPAITKAALKQALHDVQKVDGAKCECEISNNEKREAV